LSFEESEQLFLLAMQGKLTQAQLAALLMGLRVKGETTDELAGAVAAMRSLSLKVTVDVPHLIDTCGTGGSGAAKLFNISTAAAFVIAACGAHVAKHGNRAMSSSSGSADVLEAAGVDVQLNPTQISLCIQTLGVGFMFAQAHHSAMRHAAPVRKELKIRTLMNVLGPLTNPATAPCQLIGVFSPLWQRKMIEVLTRLGTRRALTVHSDGLDELSIAGPTEIVELRDNCITEYVIEPAQVGLRARSLSGLAAASPAASLALVRESLTEPDSAAADIVALNAGAALYIAELADTIGDGVALARAAIIDGSAIARLELLVNTSQSMAGNSTS
jgi:anthranilate phosphoribosyltransferase